VEVLVKAGADTNKQDAGGYTALMYATAEGRKEVVELLLKAGADPKE
jgi:ankyrin repeat protein